MTFDREALVQVAAEAVDADDCGCLSSAWYEDVVRAVLSAISPAVEQQIKEARAEALREAADALFDHAWQPGDGRTLSPSHQWAYMVGANDAHAVSDRFLRLKAEEAGR